MRTKLSPDGPEVSRIALGMMRAADWELSASALRDLVQRCIDLGVTTFDHADIYGRGACESLFGAALAQTPSVRRDIQIVGKCGIVPAANDASRRTIKHYDTSKSHILASVDGSLKRLRTDYLDVLLLHRPDPLMDADEVVEAFQSLRRSGKVRFFGVSNFSAAQFELLASRAPVPLVTNQIECSVLAAKPFEDGTVDACMKRRVAPMAWAPLGGGAVLRGRSKQALSVRAALASIGRRTGIRRLEQLALAWLLKHPSRIVPVIGTGDPERIAAAAASTDIELSREDWFAVLAASRGRDVP